MSNDPKTEGKAFAAFLKNLPVEEITRGNRLGLEMAKKEHKAFQESFRAGDCFICKAPLATFDEQLPCMHWFLLPERFKKKHFSKITDNFGFFQIQSYLRWIANEEVYAQNINEMPEESTGNKLFEVTIKYKNLEWAISCSPSDYAGHANSYEGAQPHYHFQMRIDQKPFINYSDFHINFRDREIANIEAILALPDMVKPMFPHGEGMNDVLKDETAEQIINMTVTGGETEKAPFKIDTLVVAPEGQKIDGEALWKIMTEAKQKNVTMASLLHKLPDANVRSIVSPGPGVVDQAPRSKRKNEE
jgi:hypothetical protein